MLSATTPVLVAAREPFVDKSFRVHVVEAPCLPVPLWLGTYLLFDVLPTIAWQRARAQAVGSPKLQGQGRHREELTSVIVYRVDLLLIFVVLIDRCP